jgi:hypothetical protein
MLTPPSVSADIPKISRRKSDKSAALQRAESAVVDSQLDILRRICDRGLAYGLDNEHTYVVDLFQHMKDEVARLRMLVGTSPE